MKYFDYYYHFKSEYSNNFIIILCLIIVMLVNFLTDNVVEVTIGILFLLFLNY